LRERMLGDQLLAISRLGLRLSGADRPAALERVSQIRLVSSRSVRPAGVNASIPPPRVSRASAVVAPSTPWSHRGSLKAFGQPSAVSSLSCSPLIDLSFP